MNHLIRHLKTHIEDERFTNATDLINLVGAGWPWPTSFLIWLLLAAITYMMEMVKGNYDDVDDNLMLTNTNLQSCCWWRRPDPRHSRPEAGRLHWSSSPQCSSPSTLGIPGLRCRQTWTFEALQLQPLCPLLEYEQFQQLISQTIWSRHQHFNALASLLFSLVCKTNN